MITDILQPTHLVFILVVALLVLGPKRLPEVGRSLGKGLRDFRGAMAGIEEHTSTIFDEPKEATSTAAPNVQTVQTVGPEPVEETVLVNTASTPAASTVTAPTFSRPESSSRRVATVEPDPTDFAD
jgi:sec-independent protein translocase protein TatA